MEPDFETKELMNSPFISILVLSRNQSVYRWVKFKDLAKLFTAVVLLFFLFISPKCHKHQP